MEKWEEEVINRGYAKNRKEWWFLVEHNWTNISRLMEAYLTQKEVAIARKAKSNKEGAKLWLQLQHTWERMPDRGWIQQVPGFLALCDLCSDFPE